VYKEKNQPVATPQKHTISLLLSLSVLCLTYHFLFNSVSEQLEICQGALRNNKKIDALVGVAKFNMARSFDSFK
jgi:hypothetical protein